MTSGEASRGGGSVPAADIAAAGVRELTALLVDANEQLLARDLEIERLRRDLEAVRESRLWRVAERVRHGRVRGLALVRRVAAHVLRGR